MYDTYRQPEEYQRANLSVQASSWHYSTPREDGRPIDYYSTVEVGLLHPVTGKLSRPTDLLGPIQRRIPFTRRAREAHRLDGLFEDGGSPVAGYVSQAHLQRLRAWAR